MYSIKDYVVCGSSGVCCVEDICVPNYAVLKAPHYVLQPIYDRKTKVTIPAEGGNARLRDPIAKEEAEAFLARFAECELLFCNDNRYVAKFAGEILSGGEWIRWLGLLKGFTQKIMQQRARGKTLTMREESLYNKVKNLVMGELAFALGISPEAAAEAYAAHLEEYM